ncbi:SMP-30/gluconolactonase/LRE family protein [Mycolicibacterium porcinum]|uniref:SMP-30/gluconolactonase/LRE family protein n=1 Tax=Mycolicibacterium porcinum TaxID=39693 RepID=UPI001196EC65|nr:SMP-30/gluconolactonase/LRE family protein [Mycolicibacterium porcinum]TVX99338.1 SMP-30/gluconolactonase/LRE family protein [Mycolicibacterium porcinum]
MNAINSAIVTVADGLRMPECPRWHDGHLWFSDIRSGTVHRINNGLVEVVHQFSASEEPAGLGWLPDGDLLVVGMARRVIYRVSDGRATVYADVKSFAPHQINDMIVTSDGTAFVTQLGFDLDAAEPAPRPTVVIAVAADGTVSPAATNLMVPNGIAVDDRETTLVVAESGAGQLSSFDLHGGVLSNRVCEPLPATADFPFCAPDGICLDQEGGRWVADSINKRVFRIHDGVITDEHRLDQFVLACALGDDDRRSLYICVTDAWHKSDTQDQPTGRILRVRVAVPGSGRP